MYKIHTCSYACIYVQQPIRMHSVYALFLQLNSGEVDITTERTVELVPVE